MTSKAELTAICKEYAETQWDFSVGRTVPIPDDLTHANTGRWLDATVLYADIDGSTAMVDNLSAEMAAEYYKSYLRCASLILKGSNGVVTAYDGDRVMSVFIGERKSIYALSAALQISGLLIEVINPVFRDMYRNRHRDLHHCVGIDAGRLLVAKVGVRDNPDLVWVGSPANYAAKLTTKGSSHPIRMTETAIAEVPDNYFYRISDHSPIWDGAYNSDDDGMPAYRRSRCWMEI